MLAKHFSGFIFSTLLDPHVRKPCHRVDAPPCVGTRNSRRVQQARLSALPLSLHGENGSIGHPTVERMRRLKNNQMLDSLTKSISTGKVAGYFARGQHRAEAGSNNGRVLGFAGVESDHYFVLKGKSLFHLTPGNEREPLVGQGSDLEVAVLELASQSQCDVRALLQDPCVPNVAAEARESQVTTLRARSDILGKAKRSLLPTPGRSCLPHGLGEPDDAGAGQDSVARITLFEVSRERLFHGLERFNPGELSQLADTQRLDRSRRRGGLSRHGSAETRLRGFQVAVGERCESFLQ